MFKTWQSMPDIYLLAHPHCGCLKIRTEKDEWIGSMIGYQESYWKDSCPRQWTDTGRSPFHVSKTPRDLRMLLKIQTGTQTHINRKTSSPSELQVRQNNSLSISVVLVTDATDPSSPLSICQPTPSFLRSDWVWTGVRAKKKKKKGMKKRRAAAVFSVCKRQSLVFLRYQDVQLLEGRAQTDHV